MRIEFGAAAKAALACLGAFWLTSSAVVAARAAECHDCKFSPATLQFLVAHTGLDGEQWDNIMKLVNKPEQDSLDWPAFYGYCQNIHDGRGFTIGIFGATTGGPNDTGPDAPGLFKAFDGVSGASSPSVAGGLARAGVHGKMVGPILEIFDSASVFCAHINALQADADWREAMWRTFYDVDIAYSVAAARQRGFADALAIGSFVDTALNEGATPDYGSLEGVLSRSGTSHDELIFLPDFYAMRDKVVDTHQYNQPPNGHHRVEQWIDLLHMGRFSLHDADQAILQVTNWRLK